MSKANLSLNEAINGTAQFISDQFGDQSCLSISQSRVGVGTNNPAADLDVQSKGLNTPNISVSASKTGQKIFIINEGANGHGNLQLCTQDGKRQILLSAGTSRNYINTGNPLGIGTTDPRSLLHVAGESRTESLIIEDTSQVEFRRMAPVQKAPDRNKLQTVLIDPETGKLYYTFDV